MSIIQLHPFHSPKIWGYEQWQFSTHPHGMTTIAHSHLPLNTQFTQPLPILIKYIVANDTLSVQVHPDDEYAKQYTSDLGKTECWYITEAVSGSQLICGLIGECTPEQLNQAIFDGTLESHLNYIDISAGDMIYIPAGTVHAIMGGVKLIEIQQSSDTTYRLYDWGRNREIHISESLAVIDYENKNGALKIPAAEFEQLQTPYFTVEKQVIVAQHSLTILTHTALTVISGNLLCQENDNTVVVLSNETCYLTPGSNVDLTGNASILITTW